MGIKFNASVFLQWANDNLNFQNESEDFKLIKIKEFKEMITESAGGHYYVVFIDGKTNRAIKDKDLINYKF